MSTYPKELLFQSGVWRAALVGTAFSVLFGFHPGIIELFRTWLNRADYSHGLLLIPFAGYLLWSRRELIPATITWPALSGVPVLLLASAIYLFGEFNFAREGARGAAAWLGLAGVAMLHLGGWRAWRWMWPAVLFPFLALPMPNMLELEVSMRLQELAVSASTAVFQTIGLPAYRPPNQMLVVIGETRLEVARTCSGLSMLLTFMTFGCALGFLLTKRHVGDRLVLAASSLPIAVFCNIGRIIVTGLVYHAGWKEFGDLIVHDLAGWAMMPVALGMLWLEMKFIDWILVPPQTVSLDELARLEIARAAAQAGLPAARGPLPFPPHPFQPRPGA